MYYTVLYRTVAVEFIPLAHPLAACFPDECGASRPRQTRTGNAGRAEEAGCCCCFQHRGHWHGGNGESMGRAVGCGLVQTEPCLQATLSRTRGFGTGERVRALEGWHGHILQSIGHIEYDVPALLGSLR